MRGSFADRLRLPPSAARGRPYPSLMTAVLSLLVVIMLSLLVTRVATVALTATGLSREAARFQARSAFSGAGFTTAESEAVVRHPVRRRIIMWLMLFGSAGIVAVIASFVLAFIEPGDAASPILRPLIFAIGIGVLWVLSSSRWVDARITALTMRALKRWTDVDARDYASLLQLGGDYMVTELEVQSDDWLAERDLATLGLRSEGVLVLGIHRPDGSYFGVPTGETTIHARDVLLIYSRRGAVAELDSRGRGVAGDRAHLAAVDEQVRVEAEESSVEREESSQEE